jgi:uncharacterized RDD family membrane protein YckC
MKSRFEPDVPIDANQGLSPSLIDPDAYDASEQQFAASLEPVTHSSSASARPRFIVEDDPGPTAKEIAPQDFVSQAEANAEYAEAVTPVQRNEPESPQDPDAWRREVANRLSHYRSRRRTREPRYPSLQLKFETDYGTGNSTGPSDSSLSSIRDTLTRESMTRERTTRVPLPSGDREFDQAAAPRITLAEPSNFPRLVPSPFTESTAKIIEFASYSPPPRAFDELAEPVLDRPRIIEAPDLLPPPPALGGILIEPVDEPASERRPGFEIPLQAAPMGRRLAASAIDATFVVSAFAAFAYIFFRFAAEIPPLGKIAGTGALLIALLWSAYQYLLLVYSGVTPGLKLAKLELHRFDGSPVPLRVRRWRVLTAMLSGLSLGLGYAWCFLDEDRLCWHDRITHTYMAPKK